MVVLVVVVVVVIAVRHTPHHHTAYTTHHIFISHYTYSPSHSYSLTLPVCSVLRYLIERGANVHERTIDGLNALHLAIRSGSDNDQLIRVLVDAGCEVNGKVSARPHTKHTHHPHDNTHHSPNAQTNNGDTPLHYAAYMGYVKCATLLIEKGAKLEEKGQNDSTSLHFAAREGQMDLVKLLIEKGATVSCRDKDGDTPMQCALINEHLKCAEYLRERQK